MRDRIPVMHDMPPRHEAADTGQPIAVARARILVADDHRVMRENLVAVLSREHDVVAAVPDAQALIEAADGLNPDVLVVDIQMPGLCGIAAAHSLKGGGCRAKVVFVTTQPERDFVQSCLALGAVGFVVKDRLITDLLPAVRSVLAGQSFVSHSVIH